MNEKIKQIDVNKEEIYRNLKVEHLSERRYISSLDEPIKPGSSEIIKDYFFEEMKKIEQQNDEAIPVNQLLDMPEDVEVPARNKFHKETNGKYSKANGFDLADDFTENFADEYGAHILLDMAEEGKINLETTEPSEKIYRTEDGEEYSIGAVTNQPGKPTKKGELTW